MDLNPLSGLISRSSPIPSAGAGQSCGQSSNPAFAAPCSTGASCCAPIFDRSSDHLPSRLRPRPLMLLGCLLLFFDWRPPTAGQAHTVGGSILQLGVEFPSTPADCIDMHPCDLGHQGRTTMSQLPGLQGHVPSALLLVQTTEQQVHFMVQFLVWMIVSLLAIWTLALMDWIC